jgi:transcriptional regulator of acetoin/glycerol metabolism
MLDPMSVQGITPAHAQVLRARGGVLPPDGVPTPVILDSWRRCLDAGLDPAGRPRLEVVDGADLARRRESSAFVRRLAQAQLETLSQQIAGSNFLLAFADREGVILDLYADHRFTMSGDDAGIVTGSCWTEAWCGTNGLGTALATGQSVAVTGPEHFFHPLGDISCTAAPIRDAGGAVVGALDASSYFESRQRHTQALVQMAATHIENHLFAHQMHGALVLAVHPRAEYLGTLSAGLLAFDGAGRLLAINARGRSLLAGLDAREGAGFESLFGEPLGRALGRLQAGRELRLRDALGSTLVVAVVGAPPGRIVATALTAPPREAARAAAGPDIAARAAAGPDIAARAGAGRAAAPAGYVCDDPAVAGAGRLVAEAVRMGVPILLEGETGSGKEMLARLAHAASGRPGAFVAVNCGALPAELVEAELFGYVGGAFTGARREGSPGLIAGADGGTLLLDEIGDLPLPLQAALLRFLDDRIVRPVGGTALRKVDVQLLAASHVDLDAEVAARRFRADLLYRLSTVRVRLPALRERGDFAAAVRAVLHAVDAGARIVPEAVDRLAGHAWPGNFRELRAVLTRALLARRLRGDDDRIGAADVAALLPAPAASASDASALQRSATDAVRREHERLGGSVSRTARSLGISRTTVYRHLRLADGAR